ncbi:MAG: rhodanese-like domain-containing protein, partial [Gammaproteobacteria bacterium]|nr:rhodanese-like domain-containing protein [Gammaproteobacteria bacterium]
LRLVRDEPGAVVVVIFPDNIFKYASSVQRQFPAMFANLKQAPAAESVNGRLLKSMIENSRNPHDTIEIDEVRHLLQSDEKPLLIDVRDRATFQKEHVAGALNIPLEELKDDVAGLPGDRTAPIVTVCSRGNVSLSGLLMLKSLGYRNVRSMNGGTVGWRDRGFPVGSRDNC